MINKTKIKQHTKCGILQTKDTLKTHKTLDTCNSSLLSLLISPTQMISVMLLSPTPRISLMLLSPTQMISVIAVILHTEDLFKRFYPPHRGSLLTLLSPTPRFSLKAFFPTLRISFDAFLSLTIHIHSKIAYVP